MRFQRSVSLILIQNEARILFRMAVPRLTQNNPQPIEAPWNAGSDEASWRSGYAEDCKSLHPGSIPGEASSTR